MKQIRIPIGSTKKDKEIFMREFLRVFPNNPPNKIEEMWHRHVDASAVMIILSLSDGYVCAVLRATPIGNSWELSSRYLKDIPKIDEYFPEHPDNDTMNGDNPPQIPSNFNPKNDNFNIDVLLDLISEKGYESLTNEQKKFLAKFSKKK